LKREKFATNLSFCEIWLSKTLIKIKCNNCSDSQLLLREKILVLNLDIMCLKMPNSSFLICNIIHEYYAYIYFVFDDNIALIFFSMQFLEFFRQMLTTLFSCRQRCRKAGSLPQTGSPGNHIFIIFINSVQIPKSFIETNQQKQKHILVIIPCLEETSVIRTKNTPVCF
jgi:hypothetical protein